MNQPSRFVFPQTEIYDLPQQIVLRSGRIIEFTLARSSGRTQSTRDSTRGDPNWLVRSGGTARGIVRVALHGAVGLFLAVRSMLQRPKAIPVRLQSAGGSVAVEIRDDLIRSVSRSAVRNAQRTRTARLLRRGRAGGTTRSATKDKKRPWRLIRGQVAIVWVSRNGRACRRTRAVLPLVS